MLYGSGRMSPTFTFFLSRFIPSRPMTRWCCVTCSRVCSTGKKPCRLVVRDVEPAPGIVCKAGRIRVSPSLRGEYPPRRGEGGEEWLGEKNTGYLYKAFMVARRLPKRLRYVFAS